VTTEDFVAIVADESGMTLVVGDLDTDFDQLDGWDSVHMLKLLSALEGAVGGALPVVEVMESRTLGQIHALVAE
jgi:acyl carrier protein